MGQVASADNRTSKEGRAAGCPLCLDGIFGVLVGFQSRFVDSKMHVFDIKSGEDNRKQLSLFQLVPKKYLYSIDIT